MLFFKGWLTVTLALHSRVSGDGRFFEPFEMSNVGGRTSTWTLHSVAAQLREQWAERACGLE